MTKNNDERKCAFGVFLDIIDSMQEMNKKNSSESNIKKCPFCSQQLNSDEKTCRYCGEPQPQ
jgi:predicted amidophosphoribosyltransferase